MVTPSWSSARWSSVTDESPKIVLRNMGREEEKRAIEDLTEIGYNREVIQIER